MLPPTFRPAKLSTLHDKPDADPVGVAFETPEGVVRFAVSRAELARMAGEFLWRLSPFFAAQCAQGDAHFRNTLHSPKSSGMPMAEGSQVDQG